MENVQQVIPTINDLINSVELLQSNEFYKNSEDFRLPEVELIKLVKIIFGDSPKTKIEFEIGSSGEI
ncbi:MAG: hypothetical protein KAI34_03215 [Candidatus Lokiarchaeota archaeon]|nr:hypothetical protein [Candidatus Lokiarchaeota archaeon]